MASESLFFSPLMQTYLHLSLPRHLSIKFLLQDSTIWVECEIYGSVTSLLSLTMRENSRLADNRSSVWELCAGKYRMYGLPKSSTNVSTKMRTPPHSSASPFVVKVKIEPGIHIVIHLSDSSDGHEPPLFTPILKPYPSSLRSTFVTPFFCVLILHPLPNPPFPIFNVYVLLLPCPVGKTSSRR